MNLAKLRVKYDILLHKRRLIKMEYYKEGLILPVASINSLDLSFRTWKRITS